MHVKYILLIFISLLISCQSKEIKTDENSIQEIVLKNEIKDSLYIFGKWNKEEGMETHLKYLGNLKSEKETFKILTHSLIWGMSKRATNRLLIFDTKDKYLGEFGMTMKSELPKKIENNRLIFLHLDEEDCDKEIITQISFKEGIPKEFFVECKNEMGNIYSFSKDKNY